MTGDTVERPGTVLVVEDNAVNRLALARGVEREGHQVLLAADGGEALDVLAREPVDIVILDLLMPNVDGFEVLARMGRDPELRDIPVLVVSAVEQTEQIARAIEMGAIDCLPKPFEPLLLRVRLRTGLQQARLRRVEQAYLRQELALRQNEKLVTLGRISAGLAHELNNPAGAALRTARQLDDLFAQARDMMAAIVVRPDAAEVSAVAGALERHVDPAGGQAAPPSPADRLEHEEALEAALVRLGVPEPWALAPDLAHLGLTATGLEDALRDVEPDAIALAVRWCAMRLAVGRSTGLLLSSVERVSEIVGTLRSYSFMDRAPAQEVDVRDGIEDAIAMLRHRLGGVTVVREFPEELPRVQALGGQLNQVWTNLLDNAVDAVAGTGTIMVCARVEEGAVLVEVQDDGPGIAPEVEGRVFDPFVTTKEPGAGTGLGLSIAHQIVAGGHGGRLTASSRPGRTVFTVALPLTAPPAG